MHLVDNCGFFFFCDQIFSHLFTICKYHNHKTFIRAERLNAFMFMHFFFVIRTDLGQNMLAIKHVFLLGLSISFGADAFFILVHMFKSAQIPKYSYVLTFKKSRLFITSSQFVFFCLNLNNTLKPSQSLLSPLP